MFTLVSVNILTAINYKPGEYDFAFKVLGRLDVIIYCNFVIKTKDHI